MIGARMLTISLLLGVASCSSGADPGPTSTAQPGPINSSTVVVTSLSTSPPQTTTQATGVATTTAPTSDPNAIVEVPLEDALREWRSVVISRELVIGEVVFDGETLIFSTEGIRYFAAQDGAQREIYQESGDWIVRQSMLVDGRLLLVESSEHGAESRVMSIDPTTGASEELVSLSGGPPPWSILSLTQRGEVVASQQEDGGGSCIERLGPGEPERLVCAADSSELVFFSDLDAGTLVYDVIVNAPSSQCRTLLTQAAGGGDPTSHGVRTCGLFMSAYDDGVLVWTEQPSGSDYGRVPVYGEDAAGTVYALDRGAANSLVMCNGAGLWRWDGRDGSEIRRWAPGGSVEVIYRPIGAFVSHPACFGDVVILQIKGDWANAPVEILMAGPESQLPEPFEFTG